MTQYQRYKESWPNKTDEQIIESLANELKDKVETIHGLLEENQALNKLLDKHENQEDNQDTEEAHY